MKNRALAAIRPAVLMIAPALTALCSCTKGPHGLSVDTYDGVQKAVSALRRANEYRDSGAPLFEPRLLEAERAAGEIVTPQAYSAVTAAANASAASVARSCVRDLRFYRETRNILLDRSPSLNAHEGALDAFNDRKTLDDARHTVDRCIVTLGAYL